MRAVAAVLLLGSAVPSAAQSYCGDDYKGCRPAGERMYTAYPNSPVMGKEFSFLIVGCNMPIAGADNSVARDYVIVPSDIPCSSVDTTTIPGECKFDKDTIELTKRIPATCKSSGWLCTNCAQLAHADTPTGAETLSTTAINKVIYDDGSVDPDAGGQLAPLTLCYQTIDYDRDGNRTDTWTALHAHNRVVNSRADEIALSVQFEVRGAADINAAAGLEEEPKGVCCEGLKLGDACLPLVVFLLLWLLMAGLLGLLGWMCHRNQQDIDMERNNLQFSNFGADKELQEFAAEQGGVDDDDDI
eukprot:Hpha_TRINITY_DN15740_c1_g5::TRINITY_DN15740_c1_g5_i2::g.37508::m.37508